MRKRRLRLGDPVNPPGETRRSAPVPRAARIYRVMAARTDKGQTRPPVHRRMGFWAWVIVGFVVFVLIVGPLMT
jgi:hypothetical protein